MIRVARALPLLAVLGLVYFWSPMFAWTAVAVLAITIAWRRVTATSTPTETHDDASTDPDPEAFLGI